MNRPQTDEYAQYYEKYISLIPDGDLMRVLEEQIAEYNELFEKVPEESGTYRYDVGKWTCKESLAHVIDVERVFAYRLLRISRGDETPLESFEQDDFVLHSNANGRTFKDLLDEFAYLRRADISAIKGLSPEASLRSGTASGNRVSVRALAYMMAGHAEHHKRIFAQNYLA
ncbi:MAG: DinB family protein [Acidobacteria bacterium]|nr:DinB family protein [Acidobacteriota bacterium]MCW5948109.1 DinB family protein [Pyrinomonadaceae bacterium]